MTLIVKKNLVTTKNGCLGSTPAHEQAEGALASSGATAAATAALVGAAKRAQRERWLLSL
jgi:hypothetical protein